MAMTQAQAKVMGEMVINQTLEQCNVAKTHLPTKWVGRVEEMQETLEKYPSVKLAQLILKDLIVLAKRYKF